MNLFQEKDYQTVLSYLSDKNDIEDVNEEEFFNLTIKLKHDQVKQAVKDRYAFKYNVITQYKGITDENNKRIPKTVVFVKEELKDEKKDIETQIHSLVVGGLVHRKDEILSKIKAEKTAYKLDNDFTDLLKNTLMFVDKKEMFEIARKSLREVFNLDEKDYVFSKEGDIYIKLFSDRNEMSGFNRIIADSNTIDLILKELSSLLNNEMSFYLKSNNIFKQKLIPLLSKSLEYRFEIEQSLKINKDVATQIVKYYIEDILLHTSEFILEEISKQNKEAEGFLFFYNGETSIDKNGNKFVKPFLSDEKGQTLSVFVAKGVCISFFKNKKIKNELRKNINNISTEIKEKKEEIRKANLEAGRLNESINELSIILKKNEICIIDGTSAYSLKDNRIMEMEISKLKEDLVFFKKKAYQMEQYIVKREKDIARIQSEINALDYSNSNTREVFEIYKKALARVLLS